MSKEKRISVALVLSLGTVASTATIVRVPYLVTLIDTKDFLCTYSLLSLVAEDVHKSVANI